MLLQISLLLFLISSICAVEIDPNGYVVYCPCMGRFGNQLDQTLGALAFTKGIDRTLVLPPVVDFTNNPTKADMVPFEEVFQVKTIARYLKVITMSEFRRDVMPKVWPKETRKALCWSPRASFYEPNAPQGCHAKEGNPFGPFWDYVEVDFVDSQFFAEIQSGYELSVPGAKTQWNEKFPSEDYPVLAFTGTPGAFPSKQKNWELQKYLRFAPKIIQRAKKFINETLPRPFVGIHLRNNVDWGSVCEHISPSRKENLFASAQCLGEVVVDGGLSKEMCMPPENVVIDAVVDAVGRIGAKSVFVTSDKDHMIDEINEALAAYEVKAHQLEEEDVFTALSILQEADGFIGNCVSTFSAIVSRHRKYALASPRPTSFFGYTPPTSAYQRKIDL